VSDRDALTIAIAILVAGHETTSKMIALGVLTMLTHPEQAESLRQDSDLAPSAVEEELLRYLLIAAASPHAWWSRTSPWAANTSAPATRSWCSSRRPTGGRAAFPQSNELDLHRTGHHLAFSHGLHQCMEPTRGSAGTPTHVPHTATPNPHTEAGRADKRPHLQAQRRRHGCPIPLAR
jgi:pentalenic acid synthase